jgi:hypothetical protein
MFFSFLFLSIIRSELLRCTPPSLAGRKRVATNYLPRISFCPLSFLLGLGDNLEVDIRLLRLRRRPDSVRHAPRRSCTISRAHSW